MNIRSHIDPDELRRLYFDEGLTIEEIAARFECSPTTIRRRMDDLGMEARPRGPYVERDRNYEWSPELAYVIGLITTDGNLSSDASLANAIKPCPSSTNQIDPQQFRNSQL